MHANVCRDFLILRYSTNAIIVCPPSCQNLFLKDVDAESSEPLSLEGPEVHIPSIDSLVFAGKGELTVALQLKATKPKNAK